jgi:hypothetical protein
MLVNGLPRDLIILNNKSLANIPCCELKRIAAEALALLFQLVSLSVLWEGMSFILKDYKLYGL